MAASDHLNPNQMGEALRAMHPNLNNYTDESGDGPTRTVVGFVPTETLASMHGNSTDREGIERHKAALREGRGFTDPVMVDFDPRNKIATLGEGNHRVEAARELGITHVPTRVHRALIDAADQEYIKRNGGRTVPIDATAPGGGTYWPPGIHPRHIFKGVL